MRKTSWLFTVIVAIAGSAFSGDFIEQCAIGGAAEIQELLDRGADPDMFMPGEAWPPNWENAQGEPVFATTLHRFDTEAPLASLRRPDGNARLSENLVRSLGGYLSFHAPTPAGGPMDGARRLMAEVNRASLMAMLADLNNPDSPSFETARGMLSGYSRDGMRPLTAAALHNRDPGVIKALAAAGATIDFAGDDDATPLMLAAIGNAPEVVEALLDAGADIHASTKTRGLTALRLAAACNPDAAVTALLLRRGAFSGGKDSTALAFAAGLNPNPEVCRLLLAEGLNPLESGMEHISSLAWAAGYNANSDITALLLEKAGTIDGDGLAGILGEALRSNTNIEVVGIVFHRRKDWTPWSGDLLAAALANADPGHVRFLLSAGLRPDAALVTSLHYRRIGGAASLDALLEAAGDVAAEEYDRVLLEFIRRQDSPESIRAMLRHRRLRYDDDKAWDILRSVLFTSPPLLDKARLLIREGIGLKDVPEGYPEGFDPKRKLLAASIRAGRADLARELLEEGVDANPCSDEFSSSEPDMSENLLAVAAVNAPNLIPLLLEKGADPGRGHSPWKLLEIVAEHSPKHLEALVRAGARAGGEGGHE